MKWMKKLLKEIAKAREQELTLVSDKKKGGGDLENKFMQLQEEMGKVL